MDGHLSNGSSAALGDTAGNWPQQSRLFYQFIRKLA
jgi:hypothetical protein